MRALAVHRDRPADPTSTKMPCMPRRHTTAGLSQFTPTLGASRCDFSFKIGKAWSCARAKMRHHRHRELVIRPDRRRVAGQKGNRRARHRLSTAQPLDERWCSKRQVNGADRHRRDNIIFRGLGRRSPRCCGEYPSDETRRVRTLRVRAYLE